jgi:methylmalonyl-CoA/ethylmalonyl-CoA epimerase
MRVKRVHHVTIAVRDLDAARQSYETLFGLRSGEPTMPRGLGVRAVDMGPGDTTLQLVASLEPDGPVVRFIQRRGEGVYSMALEVDDLDAAIADLAERGVRVSDPVELAPGERSAFVASAAAHGVSVQLIEIAGGEADEEPANPAPAAPLDLTPEEWSDTE